MAIVPLDKITLYGPESEQSLVLQRLQELGNVHLIDLTDSAATESTEDVAVDTRTALKYLAVCRPSLRQVTRPGQFDRVRVTNDALQIKDREDQLNDERDELLKAIQQTTPWGEFRQPARSELQGLGLWFCTVSLTDLDKCDPLQQPCQIVGRDHQQAYVLLLSEKQPEEPPGAVVTLDPRPLSELRQRLEYVEEQLEELHHQRVGLTRWKKLLKADLNAADDAAARERAARRVLKGERLFAVQGWMPREARPQIKEFAEINELALTIATPADDEQPPTLLHNPDRVAASEGFVTFYKTPDYHAWDPSVLSFLSFAIFFAMIVADAGYGIVLALMTAWLWRRMGASPSGRQNRTVLATIVGCTVVYGVMCGSYFGVSPPADSLLGRLQLLDAQSQSLMMPLTIGVGVIHLSIAHLVTAWLHRGRATAVASLGWVSVMVGGALYGIGMVTEPNSSLASVCSNGGTVLLVAGLMAVFLFSSQRPIWNLNIRNHAMRILEGLQGLTGFSGLFGDALSYLRLFALGLSSAKLSQTFNSLGSTAWNTAGFGVIAAIGIVVFGHTLNLLLSIMSGVVHGLRLNCIEFYKWSLPEEGYPFQAFAKKVKEQ